MKATIEHRDGGFSSPVYHPGPQPWGGRVFCKLPRTGAAPVRKIRLPAKHPSGHAEINALKVGLIDLRAYWQRVAVEAPDGVYVAITY